MQPLTMALSKGSPMRYECCIVGQFVAGLEILGGVCASDWNYIIELDISPSSHHRRRGLDIQISNPQNKYESDHLALACQK